jgi:hypothetical protein
MSRSLIARAMAATARTTSYERPRTHP